MNTLLFLWNPKEYPWYELENNIQQVQEKGKCPIRWTCGNTKRIQVNDRIFFIRLGVEPKGIFAEGYVTKPPYYDTHYKDQSKEALFIQVDLEILLNPKKEPILKLDILETGKLAAQTWIQYKSGVFLQPDVVKEMEAVWFNFLTTSAIRHNPFSPPAHTTEKTYTEGSPFQVTMTKYERNPFARRACVEHYGLSCTVCGFNFEQSYGELGKDYIHVHHLTQIAKIGKQYVLDPVKDLRPVCPNCHAMLHRHREEVSVDELRAIVSNRKNAH